MPAYLYYTKIDTEETMRLYKEGLTDAEIAEKFRVQRTSVSEWRRRKGLPPNIKEKVDDVYAADIKKCLKCEYWRGANSNWTELHFCHYMLETGECRKRGDGKKCLSYTRRPTRRRAGV